MSDMCPTCLGTGKYNGRRLETKRDILTWIKAMAMDPQTPIAKRIDLVIRVGQEEHNLFVDKKKLSFDFDELFRSMDTSKLRALSERQPLEITEVSEEP